MVGDGINAPALAQADVESQLVRERMWRSLLVTRSFLVSYKDRDRNSTRELPFVTSNKISFAFIYNVAGIPIAAGILFPSWLASQPHSAAMASSSVSVVTNALRLRNFHPKTIASTLV